MEGSFDGRSSTPETGDSTLVMEGSPCLPPTIGGYPVIGWLGQGGMATVLHGRDPSTGREVAIKILKPAHRNDEEIVARFVAEASALSAVRHEHIVEVLAHGTAEDGTVYQVMEKLDGETLAQRMKRERRSGERWPIGRVLNLVRQLAGALAAAHEAGVVHRDLKPENVFLVRWADEEAGTDEETLGGGPEQVKLLDFGLAKQREKRRGGSAALTQAGYTIGTPLYMSPEQCTGRLDVDERADIYALGVLIYELCTGQPPFSAPTAFEVLAQQITAPFPSVVALRPDLPLELEALLERATQKDRTERFQSMGEVLEAIDQLARLPRKDPPPPLRLRDVTDPGPAGPGPAGPAAALVPWQLRVTDPNLGPFADVITDRLTRAEVLAAAEIAAAPAGPFHDVVSRPGVDDRDTGIDAGQPLDYLRDPPSIPSIRVATVAAAVAAAAQAAQPAAFLPQATLHDASLEVAAAERYVAHQAEMPTVEHAPVNVPRVGGCPLECTDKVTLPAKRVIRVLLWAGGFVGLGAALLAAC